MLLEFHIDLYDTKLSGMIHRRSGHEACLCMELIIWWRITREPVSVPWLRECIEITSTDLGGELSCHNMKNVGTYLGVHVGTVGIYLHFLLFAIDLLDFLVNTYAMLCDDCWWLISRASDTAYLSKYSPLFSFQVSPRKCRSSRHGMVLRVLVVEFYLSFFILKLDTFL